MASRTGLRALVTLPLALAMACGGSVVFEEPGSDGGGGSGSGSISGPSVTSGDADGGGSSVDVAVSASGVVGTTGPGGGDGGAGPGPGPGPSQGGAGPSGGGFGGAMPGPGGVGGADVGGSGDVTVSSGSGDCPISASTTNQHCYVGQFCDDFRLELECEVNGEGPWTCWCYQDGQYLGSCNEGDEPSCSFGGCCESYWIFPD